MNRSAMRMGLFAILALAGSALLAPGMNGAWAAVSAPAQGDQDAAITKAQSGPLIFLAKKGGNNIGKGTNGTFRGSGYKSSSFGPGTPYIPGPSPGSYNPQQDQWGDFESEMAKIRGPAGGAGATGGN
ncbi:MAG: hypothetical protein FJ118_19515 [Deltaproteobacteria bacterium]|nr:hypothetical protein [Deltaproteobacteria bacterium]